MNNNSWKYAIKQTLLLLLPFMFCALGFIVGELLTR